MKAAWSALALGCTLLAGASASRVDADRAIETGFVSVLLDQGSQIIQTPAAVAGSEDYWLRQPLNAEGSPGAELERVVWQGPIAAGGTLVIGSGSSRKELEVISVEHVDAPPVTRIEMGTAAGAGLRVQAKDGQDVSAPALWLELTAPVAEHAGQATAAGAPHRTL